MAQSKSTTTCDCGAYKFPHRQGGGACQATRFTSYVCSECGCPCEPCISDEGIGWTEAWGVRSYHSDEVVCSDCCDAPVHRYSNGITDKSETVDAWELRQEHDAARADDIITRRKEAGL